MQKKEVQNNEDMYHSSQITFQFIPRKFQKDCLYITEMYNLCIDADNLVFPFSNYKKCIEPNNALFLCDKIEKYNKGEQDIVTIQTNKLT